MISDDQALALEQLRQISDQAHGLLEIVDIREPANAGDALRVAISIDCRGYSHKPGGLTLRERQRLNVMVSALFPLEPPELDFADKRHAGAPHVQWGSHICLYQAPQSEWRPDDGMFGFVQRMHEWLGAAAAGALDPVGLPLHPPVAYTSHDGIVVPTVNTPVVEFPWWAGYAAIEREEDRWIELGRWIPYDDDIPKTRLAPAILLPNGMPFEYPNTVADLKRVLAERSISISIIQTLLTLGALRSESGKPVYFILGAAMRGVAGEARQQHLACWCIDAVRVEELRDVALGPEKEERKQALFETWAATAGIDWRQIHEERPEIVTLRDEGSAMAWWRGRHVAILGCGAIGSALAMLLGRAGVAKMQLYDRGRVTPGLFVRQMFDRNQLGQSKAAATRFNVRCANPATEIEATGRNILYLLQDEARVDLLLAADVIIDATASPAVSVALERRLGEKRGARPLVFSMALGHTAEEGMLTCAAAGAAGLTYDLDRRCKLALARTTDGKLFLDEFWPIRLDRSRLFQPEPGCSDPTFRGSAADVVALSAAMLNRASRWASQPESHLAMTLRAPAAAPRARQRDLLEFTWPPDAIVPEWRRDYEIRFDAVARDALVGWIRRSARLNGPRFETGGVLFGEINDFLKVIWISEVSGPPPDSQASATSFVCGVEGVAALNAEKRARSRGSVQFIGMWHTHPGGAPDPSGTDREAMRRVLTDAVFHGRNFLMLIVGGSADLPQISGGLYALADV